MAKQPKQALSGVRELEDGRVEAWIMAESDPRIENVTRMPSELAALAIFDTAGAPLMTLARKRFQFKVE
jgi:hypothetical protein